MSARNSPGAQNVRGPARAVGRPGFPTEGFPVGTDPANLATDEFLLALSHDLREPLRSIETHTELVLSDPAQELGEEARQHLRRVQRVVGSAREMILSLFGYLRAESRPDPAEAVDVAAMVEDIRSTLLAQYPQATIEFRGGGRPIRTEEALLRDALTNLVANAVRHGGGPHARVLVAYGHEKGASWVSVEDDGPGVSTAARARLRDFGSIVPGPDPRRMGVGLLLARNLIRRIGGTLEIRNREPHGTLCLVHLPFGSAA